MSRVRVFENQSSFDRIMQELKSIEYKKVSTSANKNYKETMKSKRVSRSNTSCYDQAYNSSASYYVE